MSGEEKKKKRTWTTRSTLFRECFGRAVPARIASSADATLTEFSAIACPEPSLL